MEEDEGTEGGVNRGEWEGNCKGENKEELTY